MNGNLITIIVVTGQAIIAFLLAQPDVVFSPPVKVALGALSIGLITVSRYLPSPNQPIPVTVTSEKPVEVTPVEPADD
jgi:hypothetical protein